MKLLAKNRQKKAWRLLYALFPLLSLFLLTSFSFDSSRKEELLNNSIFEYSVSLLKNDFSYAIKIDNISEELLASANRHNSNFFNYRNVVSVMDNTNNMLFGKKVTFSNSSKLETAEGFTTNHLLFSSFNGKKIVDLDYFEDPNNKIVSDESITKVGVIIPYSLSLKIANNKSCTLDKLLYANINEYIASEDFNYFVAGIWDDEITSASYYNYNSFYSEFDEYIVFVNNTQVFSGNRLNAYLMLGNNQAKNLDFLHSCKNSNGGSLEISIPSMKINNFYVNGLLFTDYYDALLNHYRYYSTTIICVASGILFLLFLTFTALIIAKNKQELSKSKFFLKTRVFIPLMSVFIASFVSFCISKIRINTFPVITISSVGLLTLCLANMLLYVFLFFAFKENTKKLSFCAKKQSFGSTVVIVSFCDLNIVNASTIRINNIISILEKAGKQWIHIGFSDSSKNTDRCIGIKKYNNKVLNFISAPFLFVEALNKLKQQIGVIYVYSPLPIFSSVFVNCFAKHYNIAIVHDVCEFQNFSEVNFKKPGWFYISNIFYNRFVISLNEKVIPITTYLEKYFKSKGARTFLLPPVFDETKIEPIKKINSEMLIFTYVGFPGKKDNLKMCIDGFRIFLANHKNFNKDIQIRFYGPLDKYADYINSFDDADIKQCFCFFGICSREELRQVYEQTSYIFFLRNPKKRFSKAGFPSKVVESLFYSTPVLTNKTSDLGFYLHEPNNVVWVDDYSASSFSKSLERIFSNKQNIASCNDCRELANEKFSIKKYVEDFVSFIMPTQLEYIEE